MKKQLLFLALALSPFQFAVAGELDHDVANQKARAAELPQTVVVRVDSRSGKVSVLHSEKALDTNAKVDESKFVPVNGSEVAKKELDKDSSTSGWYFYWNYGYSYGYNYYQPAYYFYPAYNYYGYNYYYQPYYNYYANNCYYYYYRW